MYTNKNKGGFSIIDIIVKIIFAGLFIFILVWLFQKKVPNMKPFYSNVFRENIKYMQDAGESYFTDDKMPQEIGGEVKISLADMENTKLIIPFVDEDGNPCNKTESYVSVIKTEEGYQLKTNLVCDKESDYLIKILGCHTYCKNGSCTNEKPVCTYEKISQNQFKKLVTGTKTTYSCETGKGYKLSGKYCIKTTTDKKAAVKVDVTPEQKVVPAKVNTTGGGRQYTNPLTKEVEIARIETPTTKVEKQAYDCSYTTKVQEAYDCSYTTTKDVKYDCSYTEKQKSCTPYTVQESYSCNCSTKTDPVTFKKVTSCSTCYKNVTKESCTYKDVKIAKECTKKEEQKVSKTCYRDVDKKVAKTCYKDVTVPGPTKYSCPAETTRQTGSGSTLKCYTTKTTTDCEKGYKYDSSVKKCYKDIPGTVKYYCEDASYTLKGDKCYSPVNKKYEYRCTDKGYKLDGKTCVKTTTTKVKAKATTSKTKYYKYTWSEKNSLSGWTKTGKTRTINGKKICK